MNKTGIISHESLVQFFYKGLNEVNKNSICPLPQEFIFYSSDVLNKYLFSEKYFETMNGKISEKILGINFLEAEGKSVNEKKEIYKDIGDISLIQLGMFSKRLDKKNVSQQYYINLGKSAYARMEKLECSYYDIPNFFNLFSTSFEYMVNLLSHMNESNKFDSFEQYLVSSNESTNLFCTPNKIKAS